MGCDTVQKEERGLIKAVDNDNWERFYREGHDRNADYRRRWRNPIGGAVFGLMVVWLGVCLYLKSERILPGDIWWAYLIAGFGGLWILGGLIQLFVPGWRQGVLGSIIPGIALGAIGIMFIYDSWQYWPWILVAAGGSIVLVVIIRALVNSKQRDN